MKFIMPVIVALKFKQKIRLQKHQIRACMRRIRRYATVCVCSGVPGQVIIYQSKLEYPIVAVNCDTGKG